MPFPKRVRAAIKGIVRPSSNKDLPQELTHFLQRTVNRAGPKATSDLTRVFAPLRQRFSQTFRGATIEESFAHSSKILDEITCNNPTFSAVVPIVLERPDSKPLEPIGSGVLLRIIDSTFVLTAAHVTDWESEGLLLIPGKDGFMQMTGHFSYMRVPPSGKRDDDRLDVAFYRLDTSCVNKLHPKLLMLDRADVSLDTPSLQLDFTFGGFPYRKTKVTSGAVETQFSTLSGLEGSNKDYEALGLRRSRHIVIRFHRNPAYHIPTGTVRASGLPHGISGGGVFAWSEESLRAWPVRLPVAGIATEYHAQKSLLVATRLPVFINCIFHMHPDLGRAYTAED